MARPVTRSKDKGYKHILAQAEVLKGKPVVKIGVQGKEAAEQHGESEGMMTVVDIATIHEYGTEHIPERSFIRSTVDANRSKYIAITRELQAEMLFNKMETRTALGMLGQKIREDIQKTILDQIPPPLKPETIRRKTVAGKKGFIPLVDTGQLLGSITWVLDIPKTGKGGSEK